MIRFQRHITLLLIFLFGGFSYSQDIVATVPLTKKDPVPRFFEYVRADKGLVTLGNMTRRSSRFVGLNKYNSAFEKEWTSQVLEMNGRNDIDFMTVMGNKIMVFVSEHFPKESAIKTSYSSYDLDGKALEKNVVISEAPNEKEHRVDLEYVNSINKKVLLCFKILDHDEENEEMIYTVFDRDGEMIGSGKVEFPYPDDKLEVRKVLISNSGEIMVMAKYFKENKVRDPEDYSFSIFKIKGYEDPSIQELELDFGDYFITDLTFKSDPADNIFVAGFYSNRNTSQIIGTVYQKISADNELEVSSETQFDEAFLANFLSERQIDKGAELKYFFLDDIVLRSDGGVLLIAEKYYTTFSTYMDRMGYWQDQKIFHYDEIIISSLSNTGEMEWSSFVPKRQAAETNLNLSYLDVITGSNIYLLFEYDPRKLPRTIYYHVADLKGNVSLRSPLMELTTASSVTFFPRSSEQITNHQAILFYYIDKEKTYYIAKMEFD